MEIDDVNTLKEEIDKLRHELAEKETTFSEKRAQFKELYMKKEQESILMNTNYNNALEDGIKWKEEADSLRNEIEDIRNASSLSESLRLDEIEQMRLNYEKDVSTLEKTIMEKIAASNQREDEVKDKSDNVLTRMAQRVRLNTQEVMKIWKEEGISESACKEDIIKSVVQPYEEDVEILKDKIRNSYNRIDELEKQLQSSEIENVGAQRDEINRLRNRLQELETDSKMDNNDKSLELNEESVLKKSHSGNDIRCKSGLDNIHGPQLLRRNTDCQSLNDYNIDICATEKCGKSRTVSENEWSRLHLELSALKNKSNGICEMCKNYEDQLQSLQNKFKAQVKEFNDLSEENQANLRLIFTMRESNNKLTCQLNDTVANHEKAITDLSNKYDNLNDFCERLRVVYERFRESTDRELKHIVNERRDVRMKMERIESSYEHLLGIRGKKASEMEAEKIDLPSDIETAQFALLTLKEEVIHIKAANEHLNEKIQSLEIFNKEKERADNAEKEATLVEYSNDKKELESKTELLTVELNKLRLAHKNSESLEETVRILKTEVDTVKKNYFNLENENKHMKKKSQALQQELENSESVQQDFVRLSQTLQIQLEKIRQEEKELRWQFKEDVKACSDCQADFQGNNARNKFHCKHCGKLFCKCCLSEIQTGAHSRRADVCKVCHTMLVKDAVPYFSMNKP